MRIPQLKQEEWSDEQRRVADEIASGPRGGLRGPFEPLLHSPELARRLGSLGEYLRYGGVIPQVLKEMAILVAARAWTAQYEWFAHRRLALKAGLSERIADAIEAGKRPDGMSRAEAVIYDFCTELHRDRQVSDATLQASLAEFGPQGTVELIGVSGYYTTIAMVLNVAGVPLPDGQPNPLKPLDQA
jgi:4-carboxymuconolactone decarboxylase